MLVALCWSCTQDPDPDVADASSGSASMTGDSTSATATSTAGTTTGSPDGPLESCPGQPDVFAPCRTADECIDGGLGLECVPSGSDPGGGCGGATGCSAPWAQGEPCQTDDECNEPGATDSLCRHGVDPCCGEVSACVLRCTPDSCAEGERCPESGICEPVPCDDGFACAAGYRCEPGLAGDAHGCALIPCDEPDAAACPLLHECVDQTCQRASCERDDDCECGSCIAAQCWERPWECYEPPA